MQEAAAARHASAVALGANLAAAHAKCGELEAQLRELSTEADALRLVEPLLDEAEGHVRLLAAEVSRLETELEVANTRLRACQFALPVQTVDVASATGFDEPPAVAAPAPTVLTPSNVATPRRESRVPIADQRTPASAGHAQSLDAHRRALSAGLAALKASPAKRPPLDALHMGGHRRSELLGRQRTPSSLARAAAAPEFERGPTSAVLKLAPALLRRP